MELRKLYLFISNKVQTIITFLKFATMNLVKQRPKSANIKIKEDNEHKYLDKKIVDLFHYTPIYSDVNFLKAS